ncbi:MAG: radical SAM protein [Anaerolineales bacterium]
MTFTPAYLNLLHTGELQQRAEQATAALAACTLCPRNCKTNRVAGKTGFCRIGATAIVADYGTHPSEEICISGTRGSGAIFFAGCGLRCLYCQNYSISQTAHGQPVTPQELAQMMLSLQTRGCHNINLVTPTHVVPQILAALVIAAQNGLRLPLVYNSSGYENLQTLQWLDGIIDIYLPDMKYANPQPARYYSKIRNYAEANQTAVREMYRQVGNLTLDSSGVAQRGLLIRHLVLPNGLAGTAQIANFVAQELSPETHFNLLAQYVPHYKADQFPNIARPITPQEYADAQAATQSAGLRNVYVS